MTAGLIVGALLGVLVGYVIGKAYARALRAWKDLIDTKRKITGLWKRVVGEWLILIKVAAGFGLAFALAFAAGLWTVLR